MWKFYEWMDRLMKNLDGVDNSLTKEEKKEKKDLHDCWLDDFWLGLQEYSQFSCTLWNLWSGPWVVR